MNVQSFRTDLVFAATLLAIPPLAYGAAERRTCDQDQLMSVSSQAYTTLADGSTHLIGTVCQVGPADIPFILEALEARPGNRDNSYFGRAYYNLETMLRNDSSLRTPEVKRRLMALASHPEYAVHDGALSCLMEFRGDLEVRRLMLDVLRNHPNDTTRGKSAARLSICAEKDPEILPALKAALNDKSGFVRIRAAQSVTMMGDNSGLPLLNEILSRATQSPEDDELALQAARVAQETLSNELLENLNQVSQAGKRAPHSSGAAMIAARHIELKYARDRQSRIAKIDEYCKTEFGMNLLGRRVIYQPEVYNVERSDLINSMERALKSENWRVSNSAKEFLRILRSGVKK